jgi:predicted phage terminase large subunit-like protein
MTERKKISKLYYELLKHDLPTFIGKTFQSVDPGTRYLDNWHISLIAEYLEAARRGKFTRLIINMPPRALKSICVSVAWPAWLLGHNPSSRIMAASYSAPLAVKHSLDCRMVLQSSWYKQVFPNVQIARDQNEKYKFMTTARGFRFATSVGGTTTGEGGNFLILDDPLSPAQAMSATTRDMANHWFDHTFASRLNDKEKGVIVLVMQRLHPQDLTGYLLAKGGWTHLCLPAVATARETHDFRTVKHVRDVGELLHKERESAALIERAKIELGSAAFAAQYQQNPLSEESAMVRPWWFKRYLVAPASERIVQSWDTAIKSEAHHDATVCLTFCEHEGKSYLLDAEMLRVEYPELKRAFMMLTEKWKPQAILIEDRASGQQLIQDARRETQLPIIARNPKSDKITRFAAVSALIEAGRVLLPEQAQWLADFEAEIFGFPNVPHEDQVDALTQYLDWFRENGWKKLSIRTL